MKTPSNSPSLDRVWRTSFDPVVSRRIIDTLGHLEAWRDSLPAEKRAPLVAVWPEFRAELDGALVRWACAEPAGEHGPRVAIRARSPRHHLPLNPSGNQTTDTKKP